MFNRQDYIKWVPVTALVAGLLAGTEVLAQENADEGGLQVGVGLHFDLDNNLYDSSDQEFESWIARVSPEVSLSSAPGPRQLSMLYSGDYAKFFDSQDDNYADHALVGSGLLETGRRGLLDVSASFTQGHVGRGRGLTQGTRLGSPDFPSEPDEFERIDWSVEYTHGREGARGSLTFGIGESALDYSNNRGRTRFFDRNDKIATAGLAIGLQERTSFVTEARYTSSDYPVDRPGGMSLNGDDWSFLVGVTWEPTAKTEGSVRVGTQRRSFDDPGLTDGEWIASWDVAVRWSPRQYSYLDFVTSRANQETIGGGDFIDRSSYGISWTHEWAFGLESEMSWNMADQDFVGVNRQQDESAYSLALRLPQGERLLWETSVSHRERSTVGETNNLDFDGMLYTIGVNLQLIR